MSPERLQPPPQLEHAATLLEDARGLFGQAQVLADDAALPYAADWRGQFPGRARGVLLPRSADEVQAMVRWAAAQQQVLVPQGGNTGLVGGSTPDASGREWVLSTRRLNRIRRLSVTDLTLTAEAGCVLADLQAAAEAQQLLLPLSLASEGSCTLGGNLATNAGGTQVLRWGNTRDLCLGLEVVTADGQRWTDLDGLRKDHRGFNLRDLFIGSEGCLGLITAAVLRLAPQPRVRCNAWVPLASIEAALDLLQTLRQAFSECLSGFELMAAPVQALLTPRLPTALAPWAVLLECSGGEPGLAERLAQVLDAWWAAHGADGADGRPSGAAPALAAPVLAQSGGQFEALWALREDIPAAQTRAGGNLKHDISLPLHATPAFVRDCDAALQALCPGVRPMPFGHLGDGNLHYNVAPPTGMPLADFQRLHGAAITRCVFDTVARHGGSFSAEHGIGRLRRDELQAQADPVGLALMQRIKTALDPQGLFNPGRVVAHTGTGR